MRVIFLSQNFFHNLPCLGALNVREYPSPSDSDFGAFFVYVTVNVLNSWRKFLSDFTA